MVSAKTTQPPRGSRARHRHLLDELDRLRTEQHRLSDQVKRLIKTESELYEIQEQLDGQIRIYRRLYEIGKEFNATFELAKGLEIAAQFVLYELNFERCLVLLRPAGAKVYSVRMMDGYYDETSSRSVETVELSIEEPALAPLLVGAEQVLCSEPCDRADLLDLGAALGMDEYVVFPLGWEGGYPISLLAAGNTREQAPYQSRVRAGTDCMLGLASLASQAATAIDKAKFYEALAEERQLLEEKVVERTRALARSVEELKALGEVGQAVSSTLDLQRVLTTIVAHADELSGTDGGMLYEYDEAVGEFRLRATRQLDPEMIEALKAAPVRLGEGAIGKAAAAHEPVQVADITAAGAYRGRLLDALIGAGYRAVLAVPLLREDHILGGIVVVRKAPGEFPPGAIELLETFASQSALAIQNARLYRELEDKSAQLAAISKHKSEFLANMSHELRTPLNAINGFSEVLIERMFGELNDKQEEYLNDILTSGQHLLSLINDILDLSKVEAGRMELEVGPFSLREALENGVTMLKERASRHGITLGLEVDPELDPSTPQRSGSGSGQALIQADERKVKQVVFNLLSNAVKFTPDGGRVRVSARVVDGDVLIAVQDTGIGIALEDLPYVFDEFRQVGQGQAKAEGTGLGLALARKFVELHGGHISVESEPGTGTTVTFSLPLVGCTLPDPEGGNRV